MESRLSRNIENKTKKRIFFNIIGSFIVLFLLIKFVLPFLFNLNTLFAKDQTSTQKSQAKTYVAPPILTVPYTATNSAQITITGTATAKDSVKLFVNDVFTDTTTVKDDGSFSFENVSLSSGANTVRAKANDGQSDSAFSDTNTVTLANKAPSLTIDSPSDGASFSHDQHTINVTGKTDPNMHVTVNDLWAIVDNNGNYSYNLQLQNGDNPIKVIATDDAGNKTEKDIKVTYSQ